MDHDGVLRWIDRYERAWRSSGTDRLADLFTEDATYLQSPYGRPHEGLAAIAGMWDAERDGPDEVFTMAREVLVVGGDVAVARVEVRYGESVRQEYRDLWVLRFAPDGRVSWFEEWAYWPERDSTPGSGSTPG